MIYRNQKFRIAGVHDIAINCSSLSPSNAASISNFRRSPLNLKGTNFSDLLTMKARLLMHMFPLIEWMNPALCWQRILLPSFSLPISAPWISINVWVLGMMAESTRITTHAGVRDWRRWSCGMILAISTQRCNWTSRVCPWEYHWAMHAIRGMDEYRLRELYPAIRDRTQSVDGNLKLT